MRLTSEMIDKLVELDQRRPNGIGDDVLELIRRLDDGDDGAEVRDRVAQGWGSGQRVVQARRLFDSFNKEAGRALAITSFDAYLATIPEVPEGLTADDPDFPFLVLVEGRLAKRLTLLCRMADLKYKEYGYTDETLVPRSERDADILVPHWVRCNDGRKNRYRKPSDVYAACTGNVFAGTGLVGASTYLQYPTIVQQGEHVADLPASVRRGVRERCACLEMWDDGPGLSARRYGDALPYCGGMEFRR